MPQVMVVVGYLTEQLTGCLRAAWNPSGCLLAKGGSPRYADWLPLSDSELFLRNEAPLEPTGIGLWKGMGYWTAAGDRPARPGQLVVPARPGPAH